MSFLVNQIFVYFILVCVLVVLVFLINDSPTIVEGSRPWLIAYVFCWTIIGTCIGIDTMRFLGHKQDGWY